MTYFTGTRSNPDWQELSHPRQRQTVDVVGLVVTTIRRKPLLDGSFVGHTPTTSVLMLSDFQKT